MEEIVGGLWDRFIRRAAYRGYPEARVEFTEVMRVAPVFFRALGGDHGLSLVAGTATRHEARRSWLERIAGIGDYTELAWSDDASVVLPKMLDVLPTRELNRDLYLWLLALLAHDVMPHAQWFIRNQHAAQAVLAALPGFVPRYRKLLDAWLATRAPLDSLAPDERAAELAVRAALDRPGSQHELPASRRPLAPIALWLHPEAPTVPELAPVGQYEVSESESAEAKRKEQRDSRKRRAERVEAPDGKNGFALLFRAESLFTWAEYVHVNRPQDENDSDDAERAADDLDQLSIMRDGQSTASRVKFDLDLPAAAQDDIVLADGILLPEWDYKKQRMQEGYCRVQMMLARDAAPCALPAHLKPTAKRIRNQFQALVPQTVRLKAQHDGSELDVDACIRHVSDRMSGLPATDPGLYLDQRKRERDLACLLLADLSLSTDTWVNNDARVIDVVRDSLYLFSEALTATRDRFALYGFSSVRREHVRCHLLKGFDERYDDAIRGRLAALKPGFYTRMGAAIRHTAAILARQRSAQRLLLIVTDGKPNDLDRYDSRYGLEDTRKAVEEARAMGLIPFCVTIDHEHQRYLPHLFGLRGYAVVSSPAQLPQRLIACYRQLTGAA
ncbi:VWA domain-containing protein [Chitinivorax sp. PXF-14]|uniref:nitric oxide reductase activation protein NorD n=1 Tax=Chitinivorax sp. PXF-14 TaxID=3230488 RepID=UPI003467302A